LERVYTNSLAKRAAFPSFKKWPKRQLPLLRPKANQARELQRKFECLACGYTANADVNGTRSILAAEHAVLAYGGLVQSGRPLKQKSMSFRGWRMEDGNTILKKLRLDMDPGGIKSPKPYNE